MPVDLLAREKVISSPGNAVNIRRRRCGPRCSKGSTRPIEGSLGSCDITLPRRTASRSFLLFCNPLLNVRRCALGNTEPREVTKEPPTRAATSFRARIQVTRFPGIQSCIGTPNLASKIKHCLLWGALENSTFCSQGDDRIDRTWPSCWPVFLHHRSKGRNSSAEAIWGKGRTRLGFISRETFITARCQRQ